MKVLETLRLLSLEINDKEKPILVVVRLQEENLFTECFFVGGYWFFWWCGRFHLGHILFKSLFALFFLLDSFWIFQLSDYIPLSIIVSSNICFRCSSTSAKMELFPPRATLTYLTATAVQHQIWYCSLALWMVASPSSFPSHGHWLCSPWFHICPFFPVNFTLIASKVAFVNNVNPSKNLVLYPLSL